MIKATIGDVRSAYSALRSINDEVRFPQDAAWQMQSLLRKLKPEVTQFEETQLKLFKDAGGAQNGMGGVEIPQLVREDDETDAEFEVRAKTRREAVDRLMDEVRGLDKQEIEIDCAPLTRSLFKDDDKSDAKKKRLFSANHLADMGPFLSMDA